MLSKTKSSDDQVMENILATMDTLREDISKYGRHLQEAGELFNITLFENFKTTMKGIYGLQKETLREDVHTGENSVKIEKSDYFIKGLTVIIFNIEKKVFESNEIRETTDNGLILIGCLQNDYPKGTNIVVIKEVEYKFTPNLEILYRKINRGCFIPILENVTDLAFTYFEEAKSLLYRVEVNKREQIRGYMLLTGMNK